MQNKTADNFRRHLARVNKIYREDRYDADDITREEMKYLKRYAPVPRKNRNDISVGDLVVVLEGFYMSKKGFVVERILGKHIAVVAVVVSKEKVVLIQIDERYLFYLSAVRIEMSSEVKLDHNEIPLSTPSEREKVESEPSETEKSIMKIILETTSKVRFLTSYVTEEFEVDHSTEFYSHKY